MGFRLQRDERVVTRSTEHTRIRFAALCCCAATALSAVRNCLCDMPAYPGRVARERHRVQAAIHRG